MPERMLSEAEGYDLLAKYAIPIPKHRIVESTNEAIKAANEIGFPVVMKIVSPLSVYLFYSTPEQLIQENGSITTFGIPRTVQNVILCNPK